jgi:ppGpp synthetase/RelA/SpoT-type nucleotidyltranferase
MGEEPHDLKNDTDNFGGDGNAVQPVDPVIGQSDQARLQRDELTGSDEPSKLPTIGDPLKDRSEHPDNTEIIDQSGIQPQPGAPSGVVEDPYKKEDPIRDQVTGITDPVKGQPNLQDKTIQDPIGNVPHDDGMIVKPEDVQQVQPQNADPEDPSVGGLDAPALGADPNQGTNIDQGVDPNEIDPNQLHIDPETGVAYTDLTDEQGNEVPDLRFDQTPDSDEKQPEVELENEIVTKEEYEQELQGQRDKNQPPPQQPPMISEDQFNTELDKQSMDPNEPNVFDNTKSSEEPNDRISKMLNPEEPDDGSWEPALSEEPKEKKEEPEKGKEVSDSMRIQSEQVFVNPDGKVIGAPRFYDNRKKKDQAKEEFKEDEHPRDETGKFAKGAGGGKVTDDTRMRERKQAIRDITNTYPNSFDYDRAGQQAIKAEKIQNKAEPTVKEVYDNLSEQFPKIEVTGRVKTTFSMLEKLARKPDEYKDVSDLQDVSALRTLCRDVKEVSTVRNYIKKNYDVVDEENYIQKPQGGYRSIHLSIRSEEGLISEIQIRTPNQDRWANWAHEYYKPLTPEMKEYLQENMNTISDYASKMSDYFYKIDRGVRAKVPECPPEIRECI